MTLVLSVVTPTAVVQVSDRRVVRMNPDGTVRREDDESNKAVVFCNHVAFAYTGLAEMGPRRQRTDEWLVNVLALAEDQPSAFQRIASEASARFRHPLIRRLPSDLRRHEFVGSGWARFQDEMHLAPYVGLVSNSRSAQGESQQPREDFTVGLFRTSDESSALGISVGQPLDEIAQAEFDLVVRLARMDQLGVEGLAEALVVCVRGMGERNPLVGRGVMLTCLPLAAIENPSTTGMMIASGPLAEVATFLSIPPDGTGAVVYGPMVACGGSVILGFEARPL